MTVAVLATI